MLSTQLFRFFGLLITVFAVISAAIGVQVIRKQVINRAQAQVRADLASAWGVVDAETEKLGAVLKLTADRPAFAQVCAAGRWEDEDVAGQLERIRLAYGLDFLSVITPDHRVVMRSEPPYTTDNLYRSEPIVQAALEGTATNGITLMNAPQLEREQAGLAEKALLTLEDTPRARPRERDVEDRGMVILSAAPVMAGTNVVAALYGGILLNRNTGLVSKIEHSVYEDTAQSGTPDGTVTIFLHDCRISTTVRKESGDRALGTRVSKEVADKVLDNGEPWVGRAFVVRDWYLTAYDPIRSSGGEVIGMLYVGILEKPFRNMIQATIEQYAILSVTGILVTLAMAFWLASYVAKPLHTLAIAAHRMRAGEEPEKVAYGRASHETHELIGAFNEMAEALAERERRLIEINDSLKGMNRSYMETLGFISHELKTPLGSMMNYTYLLSEEKVGALNERQKTMVNNLDAATRRITEMVRHYLNLSRIENGEIRPNASRLAVQEEILEPLLAMMEAELADKSIEVDNQVPADQALLADHNMTLEVFENLLSNAVKYGRPGGTITIRSSRVGSRVEFRVRNEGAGIAPELKEKIFEKFARVDTGSDGTKKRGSGLGLFIARHIVRAHGGDIVVESKLGAWTDFVFTMPGTNEKMDEHADRAAQGVPQGTEQTGVTRAKSGYKGKGA